MYLWACYDLTNMVTIPFHWHNECMYQIPNLIETTIFIEAIISLICAVLFKFTHCMVFLHSNPWIAGIWMNDDDDKFNQFHWTKFIRHNYVGFHSSGKKRLTNHQNQSIQWNEINKKKKNCAKINDDAVS